MSFSQRKTMRILGLSHPSMLVKWADPNNGACPSCSGFRTTVPVPVVRAPYQYRCTPLLGWGSGSIIFPTPLIPAVIALIVCDVEVVIMLSTEGSSVRTPASGADILAVPALLAAGDRASCSSVSSTPSSLTKSCISSGVLSPLIFSACSCVRLSMFNVVPPVLRGVSARSIVARVGPRPSADLPETSGPCASAPRIRSPPRGHDPHHGRRTQAAVYPRASLAMLYGGSAPSVPNHSQHGPAGLTTSERIPVRPELTSCC